MTKKVLIVDDNEGILDAVSSVLELENFEVKTLSDAEQTVSTVKFFRPDIIILDVLMAGADGRDICRILKKDPETKDTQIVMISAHPGIEDSIAACGANAFLEKPFEVDDLINTIKGE